MKDKRLQAELWEIQTILYLILAQTIETDWVRWVIWFWCVVTLIGVLYLQYQAKRTQK